MKFFSKSQIFGVALATLVALSLTACGESKEVSSQVNAFVQENCPKCIFEKAQKYEVKRIKFCNSSMSERNAIVADEFQQNFKANAVRYTYKLPNDYKPEHQWERKSIVEYALTLLSMPKGVKKVYVGTGSDILPGFEFTSAKQTQKIIPLSFFRGIFYDGEIAEGKPLPIRSEILESSYVSGGGRWDVCIYFKEVGENTQNTAQQPQQRTDEAKASTNERSRANEQIKPRGIICGDRENTEAKELMCSDNELAILRNEWMQALVNILDSLNDAGEQKFKSENRAWLYSYDQCTDKECVKQNLQKATEILKSIDTRIYLTSETPNTQRTDEAKASANEQSPANEQVKPSFDCAKANTSAENLVCSDNELANLDNELSKAYANARNSLDNAGKKQLTSEQKAWLETYNQCADKECVKQNLQKRINQLQN